jgi:hypothetical protein
VKLAGSGVVVDVEIAWPVTSVVKKLTPPGVIIIPVKVRGDPGRSGSNRNCNMSWKVESRKFKKWREGALKGIVK